MASLTDIYRWFKKGLTPTEEQFKQTFGSFRHKDDKIPMPEVNGLETALQDKLDETHKTDENAHSEYLASKDASNLSEQNILDWKTTIGINEAQLLEDVVNKTTDQNIAGIKSFASPVLIQNFKFSGDIPKDRLIISTREFDARFDRIQVIGNSVLQKLEYVDAAWTRRYAAFGNNLMWDFTGNTNYRPEHPAHDSIAVFGSNQGSGYKDGTNFTFFGTTNMWLNDVQYGDYVTVIGKGNTNAKGKYNDPNRIVVAESDGTDLRDMMTNVAILGNENWMGDIKDVAIIGNHNRLYKYIYRAAILGSGNLARNVSGNPSDPNEDAILDHDVFLGFNLWKDLNKYPRNGVFLVGVQKVFDPSYRPLIEGNFGLDFIKPYIDINGLFKVNSGQVLIPEGSDGSVVIFSNLSKDLRLRPRTFIAGRNIFNDALFEHPLSTAGSFIGAGVNNFPLLGTDWTTPDAIDSITAIGQRNGLFHKEGYNIWTYGTAGHREFSNPMKDVVNVGVLGIGNGLTVKTVPTTPTSNKLLKYNELIVNLGNNYFQHGYNSLMAGYGNNNFRIVSDSIVLGNGNSFATLGQHDLDHCLIIGNNIYNESDYNEDEKTYNWKFGHNGQVFIKGHQGRGFKRTEIFGVAILEDRLRLAKMTKTQRNALTNAAAGDLIWQTDAGNKGPRIFDGTQWLALQTTVDA